MKNIRIPHEIDTKNSVDFSWDIRNRPTRVTFPGGTAWSIVPPEPTLARRGGDCNAEFFRQEDLSGLRCYGYAQGDRR